MPERSRPPAESFPEKSQDSPLPSIQRDSVQPRPDTAEEIAQLQQARAKAARSPLRVALDAYDRKQAETIVDATLALSLDHLRESDDATFNELVLLCEGQETRMDPQVHKKLNALGMLDVYGTVSDEVRRGVLVYTKSMQKRSAS